MELVVVDSLSPTEAVPRESGGRRPCSTPSPRTADAGHRPRDEPVARRPSSSPGPTATTISAGSPRATEVDLCGHATLAAAHVLGGVARFHTRSGCSLSAGRRMDRHGLARPTAGRVRRSRAPSAFRTCAVVRNQALGCARAAFGARSSSGASSRTSAPSPRLPVRGLIVTAAGDRPEIHCVSRVFAPQSGIPEDPATGSAHCTLAEFWGASAGHRRADR